MQPHYVARCGRSPTLVLTLTKEPGRRFCQLAPGATVGLDHKDLRIPPHYVETHRVSIHIAEEQFPS